MVFHTLLKLNWNAHPLLETFNACYWNALSHHWNALVLQELSYTHYWNALIALAVKISHTIEMLSWPQAKQISQLKHHTIKMFAKTLSCTQLKLLYIFRVYFSRITVWQDFCWITVLQYYAWPTAISVVGLRVLVVCMEWEYYQNNSVWECFSHVSKNNSVVWERFSSVCESFSGM